MSGAKTVVGGNMAKSRSGEDRQSQRHRQNDSRIASGEKAGKPRINRGKGRIHDKITKGQKYFVGNALNKGKGHGQRHIETCQRAGIQELLQPVA
jgi:hypothetical protein